MYTYIVNKDTKRNEIKISEEFPKLFYCKKINHILLRSEKHSFHFHFHLTFTKHISTPLKLSKQNGEKKVSYVTHSFIAMNLQKCEYFFVLLGNNTVLLMPAQHSISHILFNLILVEPQYFLF